MTSEDMFEVLKSLDLPLQTRLDSFAVPGGRIFRLTQEESRGLQILLTDEAARTYGEERSVVLVLGRLQAAARSPLLPALPDGQFQQLVFLGG